MSAAVVAASEVLPSGAGLPNTKSVYLTGSGNFVSWPVGTVAGSYCIIHHTTGYIPNGIGGWAVHAAILGGGQIDSGITISKRLTSADITAGGVTLTQTGGTYPGTCNMIVFPEVGSAYQTLSNSVQSGVINNGAGNTELVVGDLDLTVTPGQGVMINLSIGWSMNASGFGKQVTLRLRRDNVSGTVLASDVQFATVDSTSGNDRGWTTGLVDGVPTTGRYVITAQCTSGLSNPIYINTRQLKLETKMVMLRSATMTSANAGYTSQAFAIGAVAANDTGVYSTNQRDTNTTSVNSDRGTFGAKSNGGNASGGVWVEPYAASATLGNVTFTYGAAGTSHNTVIMKVMGP